MDEIEIYYLIKNKAINLQFRDGRERTFAPSAMVPSNYAEGLLTKMATIGGCCGKEAKTVHLFATADQLNAGQRTWIE